MSDVEPLDNPLIDAADLISALAGRRPPTVLDVRWTLGGPAGRDGYLAGHVPGAVFVDLDTELCGPPGAGGRHPLPDPSGLQRVLRAAGVRDGWPVVAYDGGDGLPAARAWWTLRWAGHTPVAVLDGGWPAWCRAGGPVSTEVPAPREGDMVVRPGAMPVLDADGAAEVARRGVLLDVRVGPRFRGEVEPLDPVAGHIPGAVNLPIGELVEDGGRLRDGSALRERFAAAGVRPGTPAGAYCGSGVTAAQAVLALSLAGVDRPSLYVGSWSHWVTDPRRPVAVEVPG